MNRRVAVRGGGDIATGTIYKLVKAGFDVLVLETRMPSAIRRNVAFSEAVYEGSWTVEDMTCVKVGSLKEAEAVFQRHQPAVIVDPKGECIAEFSPFAVVDAILAKKNLGTNRSMASFTAALGPGFQAGVDVDAVIETMRGHHLGRVIYADSKEKPYLPDYYSEGFAYSNTGVPGNIAGYTSERVIHSPAAGILHNIRKVTDCVQEGEEIAFISTEDGDRVSVKASISGLLRGLIRDGYPVTRGFKIADIDPRLNEYENCFTISDKARCIAGGVLEAVMNAYASE